MDVRAHPTLTREAYGEEVRHGARVPHAPAFALKGGPVVKVRMFLCDNSGATAIEYAMIAGATVLAIVAAVSSIGTKLTQYFQQIAAVR